MVDFGIIHAGERGLDTSAIINDYKPLSLSPSGIKRHPSVIIVGSPEVLNIVMNMLNILDFLQRNSLTCEERRIVTLNSDSALSDLDIFVIVENRGLEVHCFRPYFEKNIISQQ